MFQLSKSFTFEAAHMLPKHDGKCRRLHGHSWKMRVVISGESLHREGPKSGMLIDFADISNKVKRLVYEKLDHHYLNDTTGLENPTSEELSCWVYNQLVTRIPNLQAVEIDETCTSSCRYQPWKNPSLYPQ